MYRHTRKVVSHWQEESTSIFPEPIAKLVEDEVDKADKAEDAVEVAEEVETEIDLTNTVMWKRLRFLTTDFAKYVYKPLRFELHSGERIPGLVDKLYPSSVQIKSPDNDLVAVEIQEIKEIWWGGRVLPVRF